LLNVAGVKKAIQFIEANLTKPLTLTEVARESGMSKYHFARTFKALTGKTFKEYLNYRRVEQATILLRKGDITVTEVCFQVGFNDLSYFDRVFKKLVGKSPLAYQKELGRSEREVLADPPLSHQD